MALPIIPTDINGADRFNQFDPSIVGLILKTTTNPDLDYRDPLSANLSQCWRDVEYWASYPGDYQSVIAWMGVNKANINKNMIIGKLTGFWMFISRGKSYEVELYNPSWGSKGQLVRFLDYIVPTGVDMNNNYAHILVKDDGLVTGLVAADTRTRTGIYAVSTPNMAMDSNLFPHFDSDYPVNDVEKWDEHFKFNRAAWSATIYPQTGNAGGYTDLWIWHGYDFKVPISENHFGLYAGTYASESNIDYLPYDGRIDDNGVRLNYTNSLKFFGKSKWLGGYCKSHGFVLSSSNLNPTKNGVGCTFVEKSLNSLSNYSEQNFLFENLTPNTTYYYTQYYIIYDVNGNETIVYQAIKSATTLNQILETIASFSTPRFITSNSVSYNLMLNYIGTKTIKEIGVVIGKTNNPIPNAPGTFKGTSPIRKAFSDWSTRASEINVDYTFMTIAGLEANTLYYARQYVIYSDDSIYYPNCDVNAISFLREDYAAHPEWINIWQQFTTSKAAQTAPKIVLNCTFGENQLDANNGKTYISARITDTGGSVVTARGVCFNTTGNPMANGSNNSTVVTVNEAEERRDIDATFYPTVTGLKANTKYYFRAFATNATGTGYSDGTTELATTTAPVINDFIHTTIPNTIKSTSAKTGGSILNNGGSQIAAKGIVYSLVKNPTVALSTKTTEAITGTGIGPFETVLNNLLPSRDYYIRAYFTNATETKYGEEYSFRTADVIVAPTISLLESVVTTTNVTLGMNTTDDGGAAVINKIVWAEKTTSTSQLPTILPTSGHIITLTPGEVMNNTVEIPIGSFGAGKTYVFRAYSDNGQAKAVSEQKQFSIAAAQVAPVAGVCTLSSKTNTSLLVSSSISALNGNTLIEYGVLIRNLPISNENNWDEINSFGAVLTGIASFIGLTPNTLYYLRSFLSYSTPSGVVTVLGTQTTFTTDATITPPPVYPTVTLSKISLSDNLGVFQIATSGNISQKGIVYSTKQNPTFSDTTLKTESSQISVTFPEAKDYYIKAYVVQETTGVTIYSNQIMINISNIVTNKGIPLNPGIGQIYAKGERNWIFNGEGWAKKI